MKVGIVALALLPLTACVEPVEQDPPVIGMANPASVHCTKMGGRSEINTAPDGSQAGYCHLPNGKVVEEWQLYNSKI